MSDGYGPSLCESFAWYDHDTSSWRTCQASLVGECPTFSETWPASGMMRSGRAYQQPPLVPRTSVGGSSLWPTPVAKDDGKTPEAPMAMKRRMVGGPRNTITSLQVMVKAIAQGKYREMWPTPTSRDWRSGKCSEETLQRNSRPLSEAAAQGQVSGQLNPTWVEWLQGFPLGWTDLED